MINIKFVKTLDNAKIPVKAHDSDAAFDLFSAEEVVLLPGETKAVDIGLKLADVQIMDSISRFLKIEGRSGLALKRIVPTGGIIDASYRGPVKCIMNNNSDSPYQIKTGDKIAQLIIYTISSSPKEVSFSFTETVTETTRGVNGFGSTGV